MADLQNRFNFEGIGLILGISVFKQWVEIRDSGLVGIKNGKKELTNSLVSNTSRFKGLYGVF